MGLEIGMMSKHIEVKEETLHFFFTFKYINFNWVVVGDNTYKMGLEIGMMSKHIEVKEETLHFFFTFKYINFNWVVVGDNTYNEVII